MFKFPNQCIVLRIAMYREAENWVTDTHFMHFYFLHVKSHCTYAQYMNGHDQWKKECMRYER